ncbi:hypothetical protein IWX91DRAFT_170256 [Phyllosticta citricarpa]
MAILSQRIGRERHRIKPIRIRIRIRIVQHTDRPREEATRRMSRLHFPKWQCLRFRPSARPLQTRGLPPARSSRAHRTRLKQASKARGPCPFLCACLLSGRTRDPSEARKNACVPRREPPRWARVSGLGWAEDRGEGGGERGGTETRQRSACVGA